MNDNQLVSIKGIENLSQLKSLDISGWYRIVIDLRSIEPLIGLELLGMLYISNTKVKNIAVLEYLPNLKTVTLSAEMFNSNSDVSEILRDRGCAVYELDELEPQIEIMRP